MLRSYQSSWYKFYFLVLRFFKLFNYYFKFTSIIEVWKKIGAWHKKYGIEENKKETFSFGPTKFESHPSTDERFAAMTGEVKRAIDESKKVGCHLEGMQCSSPATTKHFWDYMAHLRKDLHASVDAQLVQQKRAERVRAWKSRAKEKSN